MAEISAQYGNEKKSMVMEKRKGERRAGERRCTSSTNNYTEDERRISANDRRVTIVNRLKTEVTDRRSFN